MSEAEQAATQYEQYRWEWRKRFVGERTNYAFPDFLAGWDAGAKATARDVWLTVADLVASGTPVEGIGVIARGNAEALK